MRRSTVSSLAPTPNRFRLADGSEPGFPSTILLTWLVNNQKFQYWSLFPFGQGSMRLGFGSEHMVMQKNKGKTLSGRLDLWEKSVSTDTASR